MKHTKSAINGLICAFTLIVAGFTLSANAAPYSDGAGTAANPWQTANTADMDYSMNQGYPYLQANGDGEGEGETPPEGEIEGEVEGESDCEDCAPPLDIAHWIKGGPHVLGDGTIYVVEFWASWCPACVQAVAHLAAIQRDYGPCNVQVIGITQEDEATVRAFVEAQGDAINYTIAIDNGSSTNYAFSQYYPFTTIPFSFLIDGDGRIVWYGSPRTIQIRNEIEAIMICPEGEGEVEGEVEEGEGEGEGELEGEDDPCDPDETPPTITLLGGSNISLECGAAFTDPGYVAFDECDGDITGEVVVSGIIDDTDVPGVYTITYNVSDASGNAAKEKRRAVLILDTTPPKISFDRGAYLSVPYQSVFDPLADVIAQDICDGDWTHAVQVEGVVNTNRLGEYLLAYRVADSMGNKGAAFRTVNVVDDTTPTVTVQGDLFITHTCGHAFVDPGVAGMDNHDGELAWEYGITAYAWALDGDMNPRWRIAETGKKEAELYSHDTLPGIPGNYLLFYVATDSSGNTYPELDDSGLPPILDDTGNAVFLEVIPREKTNNDAYALTVDFARLVHVVDNEAPSILLNGPDELLVECGAEFKDPVTAFDQCDGDLGPVQPATGANTAGLFARVWALDEVGHPRVDYDAITARSGRYLVVYEARDHAGNRYPEPPQPEIVDPEDKTEIGPPAIDPALVDYARVVRVQDTTAPTITLIGKPEMIVECGAAFIDPMATAHDECDGDISARITVTGTVNTAMTGSYTRTYRVQDLAGNEAFTSRVVRVKDTTPPVITLNGPESMRVLQGTVFTDPDATAMDSCSGNVTSWLTSTSTVNTATPGLYTVTYRVSDPNGNQATRIRHVLVVAEALVEGEMPTEGETPDAKVVPYLVGKSRTEAQAWIKNASLEIGAVNKEYHPSMPVNHVISQKPESGAQVLPHTAVSLVVSKGPDPAEGEGEGEGEGEVLHEGEAPVEGEPDVSPGGCAETVGCTRCCSSAEGIRKRLGDWMLVGLSLLSLVAIAGLRKK